MKRIKYSYLFLIAFLFYKPISAQVFNFSMNPSSLCYNPLNSYTMVAAQTASSAAANGGTYNWAVSPSIGVSITVAPGTGTAAAFVFTNCGVYTVTHVAFGAPPNQAVIVDQTSQTFTIFCQSNASITASSTNICAGSQLTLTGNSIGSGTWTAISGTNAPVVAGTGTSIVVTPSANTVYSLNALTAPGNCPQSGSISIGVTRASITAAPATVSLCPGAPFNLSSTASVSTGSLFTPGTFTTSIQWFAPGSATAFASTFNTSSTAAAGNFIAQLTYSGSAGSCTVISPVSVTTVTAITPTLTANAQSVCPGAPFNVAASIAPSSTTAAGYTWSESSSATTYTGNPITFTPTVATVYTVDVTYYGCTGGNTVQVGMQTLTTNIIASSQSICPNTVATFTATGGLNYTFTANYANFPTNTVVLLTSSPTVAVVSITPTAARLCATISLNGEAGGCVGSSSMTLCRMVLNTQVIPSSPSVCPGSSVSLHTTNGCGTTNTIVCTSTNYTQLPINNCASNGSLGIFPTPNLPFPYPLNFTVVSDSAGCRGTTNISLGLLTLNPTLTTSSYSICPGKSFSATASGGAGTNYTFTAPYNYPTPSSTGSVISTGTTSNVNIVTPPSTTPFAYTYTISADSAGCKGTANTTIGLLTLTPPLTSSSASVCPNGNFTLTSNMGAGTNYSFSSTYTVLSTGTSTVNNVSVTAPNGVNPAFPVVFTVVVDSAGCTGSSTINIGQLNLSPNLSLSVLPSNSICPGTTFTLSASSPTSATPNNYTFYGPNGQIPTGVNNALATGTTNVFPTSYTLLASNSGCTGSVSVNVYRRFINVSLAASAPSVCAGQSVGLTAGGVGTSTDVIYTFGTLTPVTGTIQTTASSITAFPSFSTVYTLVADSAGCSIASPSNIATVTVGIIPTFSLTPSSTSAFVCAGLPTTLSVLSSGILPANYTWTPAGPTNFGTLTPGPAPSASAVAMPTIATTYTIDAADVLGCKSQTVISVGISTLPVLPVSISSPVNTICVSTNTALNTTTLIASSSVSPISFSWSPSIGLNPTNSPTVIANPGLTTVYTATADNGHGCKGVASYTVNVVNIPNLSIVPTSNSVCAGYSSTLTAFGAAGYTWTSASFTSAIAQQSISVFVGNYTVTGTNGGACTNTTAISIGSLSPLNISILSSSPTQTTCIENNNPKYSKPVILTASGANTYVWFPYNPANMTYSIGPSTTVRPAATTIYTVIGATSICSGQKTINITVIPQFSMNVVPPLPYMCKDDSLKLSIVNIGTLAVGPTSAFSYSWTEALNAPPISITSKFTPTVLVYPQNSTTYSTQVKDSRGCVSLPKLVTVTVLPRPITTVAIPTINSVPTNTICYVGLNPGPDDVILTLTGSNGNTNLQFGVVPTYTWSSPYGPKYNSILTPVNNNVITISAPLRLPEVVTYTLTSGYNGVLGCKRIDTVSVRVIDCRPLTDVYFDTSEKVDTICAQTCITFVNRTDTAAGGEQKVKWTFRGGTPAVSTNPIETVCYNLPGKFDVILEVSNPYPKNPPNGASPGSSANLGKSQYVKVVNVPNVTIFAPGQLGSDTTIRIGTPIEVNATGALFYEWTPNYNITSTTKPNVVLTPYTSKQYILTGKNSRDCFSSDTLNVIVIEDCGEMFVPNAFSPNGDGVNDVLYVRGICLKSLSFMVFNRWGEKVFETSNQSIGWDGTYKGDELNTGVYVFRLEGRTYDGKSYSTKGNLTLIR